MILGNRTSTQQKMMVMRPASLWRQAAYRCVHQSGQHIYNSYAARASRRQTVHSARCGRVHAVIRKYATSTLQYRIVPVLCSAAAHVPECPFLCISVPRGMQCWRDMAFFVLKGPFNPNRPTDERMFGPRVSMWKFWIARTAVEQSCCVEHGCVAV